MTSALPSQTTRFLARPEGQIAYDITGSGRLVLLGPGMGDLRAGYRFLAPALVAAGYHVVTADLRGPGESSAMFSSYGDLATADDLKALLEELGEPAVIVGNSMGAASGVLVAASRPELVDGLVLVGPFVRTPKTNVFQRVGMQIAMAPFWAAAAWNTYLPKLYAGARPDDFDAYRSSVVASLRRPGYGKAFALTTRTSHDAAEAILPSVTVPTLVVMGELDPDFSTPASEAAWVADAVSGSIAMITDAGHYPQSQQPVATSTAITNFLGTLASRA